GPVPLPPPPGDDVLKIDEPSGLHLQPHPMPTARPSGRRIETFGGVTVTPPSSNGAQAAPPVVVIAGPAPRHVGWHKWAALGGLLATLALGATVIVLLRKPTPVAPAAIADPQPRPKTENEPPITVVDPAPTPTAQAAQQPPDPKRPAVAPTSKRP